MRLPGPLVPLRELIAQELLNVMLRVARPLANEIAAANIPLLPPPAPAPPAEAAPGANVDQTQEPGPPD